ncbi:MAG: PQQ-like beta-propeller repeat protein [Planctomycetaceae bacterium]|jgi:outer membrane protein assembly factor BamB|nr:PQQ-like beta-propeller repeat protein [Planctomycetaceae bacterium]MBT6157347.1 PQQ-like beta-propeller repeat protein [Planctomycetaceae bacterium]
MRIRLLILLALAAGSPDTTRADDWPQWLGPQRDSVWREQGIVERFPDSGLKVKWRVEVSLGYSGPAVADGRVFVTDYVSRSGNVTNRPGSRDALEGTERVLCFAADSGKLLWKHEYDRTYRISYPGGPRCTPSVDSGKVYALGAEGDLLCLNAADGNVIWSKELTKEYKTESPIWGFAAHPLIDGDLLYCLVGGKGSVAVAFNKNTGEEVWRALTASSPGYCPPTMIEHAGTKQLLIWHADALNALNPLTGKPYWSVPLKPGFGMSIVAPRKLGRHLFASGYGKAGVLLKLDDTKPGVEVVWRGKPKTAVYSENSTPFLLDGMIYGIDGHQGSLIAARIKDGERLWESFRPTTGGTRRAGHGTAFLVKHKNGFFLFSETGDLILAKLSPKGYEEISRFHVLDPTNTVFGRNVVWSHPAFAERCVFARNDKELVCVSLAADQ